MHRIQVVIRVLDVPMIVSLHAITSIKHAKKNALVVMDKMDVAMEIGATLRSQTQSWSHEKVTRKLSFILMWWIQRNLKTTLAMTKSIPVMTVGMLKAIGSLVRSNLAIECSSLVVKDLMATIAMNSFTDHHNGPPRSVQKSASLIDQNSEFFSESLLVGKTSKSTDQIRRRKLSCIHVFKCINLFFKILRRHKQCWERMLSYQWRNNLQVSRISYN